MVYRTIKTSEGHKFRVKLSDDDVKARRTYWMAVTLIPFISSAMMFLLWVKMG